MSHFAQLDENDNVIQVLVIDQDVLNSGLFGDPAMFVQTSYNTRGGVHYKPDSHEPSEDQSKALRKNYANVGDKYDRVRDAFIKPKPYPSWLLDETTCLWNAPVPMPRNGRPFEWDEATLSWKELIAPSV